MSYNLVHKMLSKGKVNINGTCKGKGQCEGMCKGRR